MSRTSLKWIFASVVLAAAGGAVSGHAQVVSDPDFTGIWMPLIEREASVERIVWPAEPPYTEYGQAPWDAYTAEFDPITDDPAKFCVHPGMPRSMLGTPTFPIEIFHRPHDLTMFLEAYYQYRKIYIEIEGRDHPEPILSTRMGYSIAHWEDDTLVVETSHLAGRDKGRILMSDDARVFERIHMEIDDEDRRLLVIDLRFVDPLIYAEPVDIRGVWYYSPDTPVMEYVCSQTIYDEHIAEKRAAAAGAD
ncbi:hypothetical protein [Candidatus Rariloculus sp.]|uniref:hypothetical protein n=1 Tax=Candidatus Rariloculus sp. TaxID=3101265 RepID=UPI003D0C12E5